MLNLRSIDLVSLRLLVHCREHGSISAAASYSNLSVMGASVRLRRAWAPQGPRLPGLV
jgi:hypothetical protein